MVSADLYLWLRFIKWIGIVALFVGTVAGLSVERFELRRRWAFAVGLPGLLVTWAAGFMLVWATRVSVLSAWILAALVLSLVASQFLMYAVAKPGRGGPVALSVALGTLVACLALMVWKPG